MKMKAKEMVYTGQTLTRLKTRVVNWSWLSVIVSYYCHACEIY